MIDTYRAAATALDRLEAEKQAAIAGAAAVQEACAKVCDCKTTYPHDCMNSVGNALAAEIRSLQLSPLTAGRELIDELKAEIAELQEKAAMWEFCVRFGQFPRYITDKDGTRWFLRSDDKWSNTPAEAVRAAMTLGEKK